MKHHLSWIHRSAKPIVTGLTTLFLAAAFSAAPVSAGEAPALAEKVAAGELPPLNERLPETPLTLPEQNRP